MSTLRFDDKVAIITGSGRGLGREYARVLASRGARIVVNDLGVAPDGAPGSENPAHTVVAEIMASGGIAIANCDSVVDGAKQIVADALDHFGRLDILINNAGFGSFGGTDVFAHISASDWNHLLDTHLGGTVNMARAAWPHLTSNAGRIINTSSSAAFGAPSLPHYSTAKSAMIGLTRSLAGEGQRFGMSVNAVMPTATTRSTAQIPNAALCAYMDIHFTPDHVAPFVVWLAHETTAINGEIFAVGGGNACRVVLARGQGTRVSTKTPEAWAAQADRVMGTDHLSIPLNALESLCCELNVINDTGKALADMLRGHSSIYLEAPQRQPPSSSMRSVFP